MERFRPRALGLVLAASIPFTARQAAAAGPVNPFETSPRVPETVWTTLDDRTVEIVLADGSMLTGTFAGQDATTVTLIQARSRRGASAW